MKKVMMMALAAAMMCGCEIDTPNVLLNSVNGGGVDTPSKRVTFNVTGDEWSVVTRSLTADGQDMSDLWLFDYMDGELVKTLHKSQGDADFDEPTLSMAYGDHHVYFVASRGKTPTISGSQIVWAQPSDTFWKDVTVTVGSGSASNMAVVLNRVATRLRVAVKDQIPDGVAKLCVGPSSWFTGLDYTTGSAVAEQHTAREVTVPETYIGTTGSLAVSIFGMSDSGEWTSDMDISAKDADGNILGRVVLDDVPFLRNRTTEVSGNLFASSRGFSVSLSSEWKDSYTIEW
ncbi:MAG: hypothetical protein II822_10400 [Prevotella sp.]|nr:hypothetical protein [Prevotella sp.]